MFMILQETPKSLHQWRLLTQPTSTQRCLPVTVLCAPQLSHRASITLLFKISPTYIAPKSPTKIKEPMKEKMVTVSNRTINVIKCCDSHCFLKSSAKKKIIYNYHLWETRRYYIWAIHTRIMEKKLKCSTFQKMWNTVQRSRSWFWAVSQT